MKFYSTNRQVAPVTLREAVLQGLPADRGLFMPEAIERLPHSFLQNLGDATIPEIAGVVGQDGQSRRGSCQGERALPHGRIGARGPRHRYLKSRSPS